MANVEFVENERDNIHFELYINCVYIKIFVEVLCCNNNLNCTNTLKQFSHHHMISYWVILVDDRLIFIKWKYVLWKILLSDMKN